MWAGPPLVPDVDLDIYDRLLIWLPAKGMIVVDWAEGSSPYMIGLTEKL